MSEDVRRQVSAELLQYLGYVWDLHYIGTRAWQLEANEEVFRMAKIDGDYAFEYAPEEGTIWNFELDAAALREIVRGGVREIDIRVRPDDRGQYIGDREGAEELVRELVAAGELELEVDASDAGFEGLVDALSAELAMWFGDMRSLSTVGDQRYAVTELVEWLLNAPGVEELYLLDIDLYWLLHRRLWDMRDSEESGGEGEIDMAGLMAMLAENPEPAPAAKEATGKAAKASAKAQAAPPVELVDLGFDIAEQPLAAAGHDAADAAGVMLDFPLFSADMEQAGSYVGPGFCVMLQREARHVFELGIGDFIRCVCTKCKTENYLDAMDAADVPCVSCGTVVAFPSFPGDEVLASYEAIRAGDVAMTKDTEFGMIGPEQAAAGLTHGEPDMESDQPQVELVELEDGWMGAKLVPDDMWELLRTPTFVSWQGEVWLFSEGRPMAFRGSWSREDFNRQAAAGGGDGNGKALFEKIVEDLPPFDIWDRFEPGSEVCVYVFECAKTGVLRANWDMA